MDIKFYLLIFWRRFPYFLILLTLGTAAGIAVSIILPPVYVAQARLVVESEQIPDNLARTTVQTDASEQLQIIQQRIMTRDNLLEMSNRLGIYRGEGRPDKPMTPDEIVSDLRQRVRIRTSGGSVARGQSTATIVNVGFNAPTAQMAASVTNEVVTLILDENIQMRTSASGDTLAF
ncbi:MAG: Wzz/FepE/Etk N-terminal domain-containing protein, partial [Paracoccaceae bacterium]